MGKRKRQDDGFGWKTEYYGSATKPHKPRKPKERSGDGDSYAKSLQHTESSKDRSHDAHSRVEAIKGVGSSKDAFRAEWTNASERRKRELVHVETPADTQKSTGSSKDASRVESTSAPDRRKSELVQGETPAEPQTGSSKRKKKHKKKKSHHDPKEASVSAATALPTSADADQATSTIGDGLDDSLVPTGTSKYQRRRWRRKLIKQGLMPKDQRPNSENAGQLPSHLRPPSQEQEPLAWADKPIGRKAMARSLATTPLMQQPPKSLTEAQAKLLAEAQEPVRLLEESIGREAMLKWAASSSLMPPPPSKAYMQEQGAIARAGRPMAQKAMTRGPASTSLMQLPPKRWEESAAARAVIVKRSTPWRRSAAESSELVIRDSSVISQTDAKSIVPEPAFDVPEIRTTSPEARRPSQRQQRSNLRESVGSNSLLNLAPPARAKRSSFSSKASSVPTYSVDGDVAERFRRFSAAAHGRSVDESSDDSSETSESQSDDEFPPAKQSSGTIRVDDERRTTDAQETSVAPHADQTSATGQDDGLTSFSELMSRSEKRWQADVGVKRNIFGSEAGGERSSTPLPTGPLTDVRQGSVVSESQISVPLKTIDDESFDAHQAIEDVLQGEMKMTRELPAGKRESIPSTDLERKDEILTQDFSDRRVTRSASKAKPAILVKRIDSAIPDTGNDVLVVRSMRLPEEGDDDVQGGQGDSGMTLGEDEETTFTTNDIMETPNLALAPTRRGSSSPLSELSQSPSPPQKRSLDSPTFVSPRVEQSTGDHGENEDDEDTIAVAVVEQAPEPRRKRKMTGRTSKHFSTPKTKRKKSTAETATEKKPASTPPPDQPTVQEDMPGHKPKRTSSMKDLLNETRILLGDAPPAEDVETSHKPNKRSRRSSLPDQSIAQTNVPSKKRKRTSFTNDLLKETRDLLGDVPRAEDQVTPQRPEKRSRRSSGTLANLSDANIIESRSRHLMGSALATDDPNGRSRKVPNAALENNGPAIEDGKTESEKLAKSMPMPNPSTPVTQYGKGAWKSWAYADKSKKTFEDEIRDVEKTARQNAENEKRSRRNVKTTHVDGFGTEAQSGAQAEDSTTVAPVSENTEQPARPKKRSRRSSGTIAILDASNIFESRSRRQKESSTPEIVEADAPDEADPATAESPPEERPTKAKAKRKSTGKRKREPEDPEAVAADDLDEDYAAAESPPPEEPPKKTKAKRKYTTKRSIYFTPPAPPLDPLIDRVDYYNTTAGGRKKRVPAGTSTALVPSIHVPRFGIIQERLWHDPFWLLIAVTFLNKTTGRAAVPVFWALKDKYETPEGLAGADQKELCEMIRSLGLQTQRSKRLIAMAKAWAGVKEVDVEAEAGEVGDEASEVEVKEGENEVEEAEGEVNEGETGVKKRGKKPEAHRGEPVKGMRWRTLHYPVKGDGKAYKANVAVEEDTEAIAGALEIGHIPGCGPYAWDSWRIFCRDVLRGVATDYNGQNADAGELFEPEWQRVLPLDKELRATLRWMWLREGWIWDPLTGQKRMATNEEMEAAVRGQMEMGDEVERRFAERAAADARLKEVMGKGKGVEGVGVEDGGEGRDAEDDKLQKAPQSQTADTNESGRKDTKGKRGKKRAATPEMEDDGLSDNIVVSPAKKKRRTSGRTATSRALEN